MDVSKSQSDIKIKSEFGTGDSVGEMYSESSPYPGYLLRLLNEQNPAIKKRYTKLVRKFAFNHESAWSFMKSRFRGLMPDPTAKIRILDVGSGTGEHSLQFALAFPNAEVVGVNFSPGSVAAAIQLRDHFQVQNIDFFVKDLINDDLASRLYFPMERCLLVMTRCTFKWLL